jgi:hypothetical protein
MADIRFPKTALSARTARRWLGAGIACAGLLLLSSKA